MSKIQNLFWVRYEPRQSLAGLVGLSPAAELAHRRMADFVWAGQGWPSTNPIAAAHLARVDPASWEAVLAELRTVGWYVRAKRFHCRGVSNTLLDSRSWCHALSTRARRAANARWHGSKPANDDAMLEHPLSNAETVPVQYSTVQYSTKAFNAERLTRSGSTRKKEAPGEPEFIKEVEETVTLFSPDAAPLEKTNWGGWWRNRYRESADKARRVLAEVRAMVKERTIRKTPGAAAVDLWKRLP